MGGDKPAVSVHHERRRRTWLSGGKERTSNEGAPNGGENAGETGPPTLTPPTPRPPGAPLALAGIRVADFSHFIAGPLCSMILADMGAEVIKIEKADGGDDFRRIRPAITAHEGAPYLWANRNKKSIALDLNQPEARRIARGIVDRSDVVLENFSTGVMAKFGLDYATVAADEPDADLCVGVGVRARRSRCGIVSGSIRSRRRNRASCR